MRRNKDLLKKRQEFIVNYVNNSPGKTVQSIVLELSEKLFISERTIWNDWINFRDQNRKKDEQKTT